MDNIFTSEIFTPKDETSYVNEDNTLRQALEKFDYYKYSVMPVLTKEGKYVSTVSEGDILRYIKNEADFDISIAESILIKDIEKYRPYKACSYLISVDDVIALIMNQNFVPIIDDNHQYMGIVKRKSVLEYMVKNVKK